jgi:hypothetical protein
MRGSADPLESLTVDSAFIRDLLMSAYGVRNAVGYDAQVISPQNTEITTAGPIRFSTFVGIVCGMALPPVLYWLWSMFKFVGSTRRS